jgi:hypothetical protein
MLITGSAGFGKTSFCQHYARDDAKALISKKSTVLPVYVKLHHLASRQLGTFEEELFPTTELRSSINKNSDASPRIGKIRLYLDGLDEVPRVERQRELMQLARLGVDSDPRIEVIVTARNYINGPWLNWMPRVSISEMDENQISDLVRGLLGNDEQDVDQFFRELKKVPSLHPLMRVPLLGTLIVSVYKKRTTLPENRLRLYETFLNLMCGGWDLAKNVRRRTDFGSVGKLSVLTRLAGHMQLNRDRECNEQSIRVAVDSTDDTCVPSVTRTTLTSASAPPASIRIIGLLSTFLYHCVSDPCTGRRKSLSSSNTNQTGIEMLRPDFLPVTLMLISRCRERRSFRASFRAAMCTPAPYCWL